MILGNFSRRLIYVVNRRTVVDQATLETERLRNALATKEELAPLATALRSLASAWSQIPLAVSTLRGQFADNALGTESFSAREGCSSSSDEFAIALEQGGSPGLGSKTDDGRWFRQRNWKRPIVSEVTSDDEVRDEV